ncbi:UNVERIFIED_CONTAM: hypothetical protein GTU68_027506 [Idotea baltica]|nr:hypothetical protein [Idotea baltica]
MGLEVSIAKCLSSVSGIDQAELIKGITDTKDISHGDYAFPCFQLSKSLKKSPNEIAIELKGQISLPKEFSKVEALGPYLNFFLDRSTLAKDTVSQVLEDKFNFGKSKFDEKIVIDYSSPNIAKPFHVGHFRTTAIGHSLEKIYRHRGYNVISINHLGDWGTQFGFVYAGKEIWGLPENPEVSDLVNLYKEATQLKADQEEDNRLDLPKVNQMARDYFINLEAGQPEAVKFWELCLEVSMKYLRRIYERLGVNFDYFIGESFYRDQLNNVKVVLEKADILSKSRDSLGVDLGKELGFARVFSDDGRSLYLTRDIATALYRYKTYQADEVLYVVGAPQSLHFKQLKSILEKVDPKIGKMITHVPYGHVPGIKTRGSNEDKNSLKDLIDEAHDRALEVYRTEVSKRPEDIDEELVAESVGLGALFFNYLQRSNIKDFHFNWESALNFQGDTGPYLQYALARLYSIESQSRLNKIELDLDFDAKSIIDDDSYRIVKLLSDFPNILDKVIEEKEPYYLCFYSLSLAKALSSAYKKLRVIGEKDLKVSNSRLALFTASKYILERSLSLLGIPPLERM